MFSPHFSTYEQDWLLSCFSQMCLWCSNASLTNNRSRPLMDVDSSCAKTLQRSWLMSSKLIEYRLNLVVVIFHNPSFVQIRSVLFIYLMHAICAWHVIILPVRAPFPFCGGSGGRNRTFSNTIHFQKFIGVPPHLHTTTHIPFGKRSRCKRCGKLLSAACTNCNIHIQIDFRWKP